MFIVLRRKEKKFTTDNFDEDDGYISADNILMIVSFYFFTKKICFDISCKLSHQETICTNCQNLFSRENKKEIF